MMVGTRLLTGLAVIIGVLVAMTASGQGATLSACCTPSAHMRTWSAVGPGAPLVGARVVVRDRNGKVVARGRTTRRGTRTFRFPGHSPALPLTVTTYGGRAVGKAFAGNLTARVFALRRGATSTAVPVVHVDLISTAASTLGKTSRAYSRAVTKVRRSLRIHKDAAPGVLRTLNSDVGYRPLMKAVARLDGGFNAFVRKVAAAASRGTLKGGLRPTSAADSGPAPYRPSRQRAAQNAPPDPQPFPLCQQPPPSQNTSQNASSNVIQDFAAEGIGDLLMYAGLPQFVDTGVVGMLLGPLGRGEAVVQASVDQVISQLSCIDNQITFLEQQIGEIQLSLDVDTAVNCSNAVIPQWRQYVYLVNDAAASPLNATNQSLMIDLTAWGQLVATCGQSVEAMLFGTAGDQPSAWQQLNQNTMGRSAWYTQSQVQDLQTFLSYWGAVLYMQFVLTNEFYNYNGATEAAQAQAGTTIQSAPTQDPPCSSPPGMAPQTATSATFCVYANNITHAFPGDLFSDEIGVIGSGQAVNAIPGGMIAGSQPAPGPGGTLTPLQKSLQVPQPGGPPPPTNSPLAMDLIWWFNYYLSLPTLFPAVPGDPFPQSQFVQVQMGGGNVNCTTYYEGTYNGVGYQSACPSATTQAVTPNFAAQAVAWFNAQGSNGLNPLDYGSAQETFTNPQAVNRTTVTSAEIAALGTAGPGAQSAGNVFFNAINQTPVPGGSTPPTPGTPAWGSLSPGQAIYMAADTANWSGSPQWGTNSAVCMLYEPSVTGDAMQPGPAWGFNSPLGGNQGCSWSPYGDPTAWPNSLMWSWDPLMSVFWAPAVNPSQKAKGPALRTNYVTAFLSGRVWWPASSGASTYSPPPPPT